MYKYDKKILLDYINGNDIDGYDVNILESDLDFIKELVEFSNDKCVYGLCDIKLKQDFNLMKYFVFKFKYDKKFVLRVVNDYLALSNNQTNNFELYIIVSDLFNSDINDNNINSYKIRAKAIYNELMIKYASKVKDNECEINNIQLGFSLFYEEFGSNEIIINYIAKNMLDDIFRLDYFSLEQLVHYKFKQKSALEKFGINEFIISYIKEYDSDLSDYVFNNIGLIKNICLEMKAILENYDNRAKMERLDIKNWIEDYITKYSLDEGYLSGFQLIKFIVKDLEIEKILFSDKSDYLPNEFYYLKDGSFILDFSESDKVIYEQIKNDEKYLELKRIILDVVKNKCLPDNYVEEKEIKHKCYIMRLKKDTTAK